MSISCHLLKKTRLERALEHVLELLVGVIPPPLAPHAVLVPFLRHAEPYDVIGVARLRAFPTLCGGPVNASL